MSELLDSLGLDPEEFTWQQLGLCRNVVTSPSDDIVYDAYESDKEIAKAADQMCLHCPVMKECFFAGSKGEVGLWGGVFWNGSGKPDRNKNSHKTEEQWAEIYDRVRQ